MHDVSKMSVKELKAYIRLYKKVHCMPYAKLEKPALVSLAERIRDSEKMAHMTDEAFEEHMAEMKDKRDVMMVQKGLKKQVKQLHKTVKKVEKKHGEGEKGEEIRKLKKGIEEVADKLQVHKRQLTAEHLAKMKAGREAKKLGAPLPVEPVMKVVKMEKKAEEALMKGMVPEKKKRVLSAEHLAKMKAGREAKKAKKQEEARERRSPAVKETMAKMEAKRKAKMGEKNL